MTLREGQGEWPDLEHYSDIPLYNTKAVVQQTGVPAPTLRAWERRYAILSPERANNAYRLYSERDIATIRWLKVRVEAGMSISHAIALLRHMNKEYQRLQEKQKSRSRTPSRAALGRGEVGGSGALSELAGSPISASPRTLAAGPVLPQIRVSGPTATGSSTAQR